MNELVAVDKLCDYYNERKTKVMGWEKEGKERWQCNGQTFPRKNWTKKKRGIELRSSSALVAQSHG